MPSIVSPKQEACRYTGVNVRRSTQQSRKDICCENWSKGAFGGVQIAAFSAPQVPECGKMSAMLANGELLNSLVYSVIR